MLGADVFKRDRRGSTCSNAQHFATLHAIRRLTAAAADAGDERADVAAREVFDDRARQNGNTPVRIRIFRRAPFGGRVSSHSRPPRLDGTVGARRALGGPRRIRAAVDRGLLRPRQLRASPDSARILPRASAASLPFARSADELPRRTADPEDQFGAAVAHVHASARRERAHARSVRGYEFVAA